MIVCAAGPAAYGYDYNTATVVDYDYSAFSALDAATRDPTYAARRHTPAAARADGHTLAGAEARAGAHAHANAQMYTHAGAKANAQARSQMQVHIGRNGSRTPARTPRVANRMSKSQHCRALWGDEGSPRAPHVVTGCVAPAAAVTGAVGGAGAAWRVRRQQAVRPLIAVLAALSVPPAAWGCADRSSTGRPLHLPRAPVARQPPAAQVDPVAERPPRSPLTQRTL
eukprot:gene8391-13892_t